MRKPSGLNEKLDAESTAKGRVTKRNISGRTYYYHEWEEDGKKRSRTITKDLYETLKARFEADKALRKVEAMISSPPSYKTHVILGNELKKIVSSVMSFKKRDCYKKLHDYLYSENNGKVFILYGLRRTGKTTLMRQSIFDMNEDDFSRCAFIQVTGRNTLADLNDDLKLLSKEGFCYVYIDEVTYLQDFIEGAELFSDIYASLGMKIVLSGTDSFGFYFSKREHLFDRTVFVHTTYIPYREFARVLGKEGIDEYISFGGTMSKEGINYNESPFFDGASEYLDTAVCENIQHSLKHYQDGGHFRELKELYDAGELTSAINCVIEDMNHEFTIEAINSDFHSHDFGISARNIRKDRFSPDDTLDKIDKDAFLSRLKKSLSIVEASERKVPLQQVHLSQIKEYLFLLDFLALIDVYSLPTSAKARKKIVVTQPAIRYSEAKRLVSVLMEDPIFEKYSQKQIESLKNRILDEVKGRMMEDIVLLESSVYNKGEQVFKLEFPEGEFDMVKVYGGGENCELYEIKHSSIRTRGQFNNLLDEEKCLMTAKKYGPITRKCVIYRGESIIEDGIDYLNVEEYLSSLI